MAALLGLSVDLFVLSPPPLMAPAEYFVEGMMRRLLDRHDPTSRKLLQSCVFYVVPCM